jgi:hypothetical protein
MAVFRPKTPERELLRRLTKQEIDRKVEAVVTEVTWIDSEVEDPTVSNALKPRWIAPAELVRRMRRFIIYN